MLNKILFQWPIGERVFAPRLVPSLAFLLLLPVLLSLGLWQLDRADEKQQMLDNLQQKSQQTAVSLSDALAQNNPDQSSVVVLGEPKNEVFIVIDNQKQGKRLGFEVFGLFQPEDSEQQILVSRGWLPRKDFYQKVPNISEFSDSLLKGKLYFPKGANPVVAANARWESFQLANSRAELIGGFDLQTIAEKVEQMGYHIAPFVVRQQAESDAPFVRDWPLIASPPQKHTAYAVQWFGMALVLIIIFLVVNLKRRDTLRQTD